MMLKKAIGFICGLGLLIFALCFGAKVFTSHQSGELVGILDRFNPLVPKSEVYVKIKKATDVNQYGTAFYKQEAVFPDGRTRTIEFNGMGVLKENHYLKIANKGAYVETYTEVKKEAIPKTALAQLEGEKSDLS